MSFNESGGDQFVARQNLFYTRVEYTRGHRRNLSFLNGDEVVETCAAYLPCRPACRICPASKKYRGAYDENLAGTRPAWRRSWRMC